MIAPENKRAGALAPDEKKSSIMIAVTSPKNKVIYSNLFVFVMVSVWYFLLVKLMNYRMTAPRNYLSRHCSVGCPKPRSYDAHPYKLDAQISFI